MLQVQTRCRSVHVRGFITGQKTVENQDWVGAGHWASGLPLAKPFYTFVDIHPLKLKQLFASGLGEY